MSADSPKPEKRRDTASGKSESAQERLDALTAKKPDKPSPPSEDKREGRPVLTEKQRIEARRARRSKRTRKRSDGKPLARGAKAVGFELKRTGAFIGGAVLAVLSTLGPAFAAIGRGLAWLLGRIRLGLVALARLASRALSGLGRVVVGADRLVTPHRALLLVAGLAGILLAISQFKGLGQIEIGQAGYAGIEDLARAPAIDKTTPAGVHTRIFIPIALIAIAAVVAIVLGTVPATASRFARFRRISSMVLITIGLLTVVVALLVDLPRATDTSEAALAYAGVKARLLAGFWLELAAGATLAVTGIALLLEPSASRARQRGPRPERGPRRSGTAEGGSTMATDRAINSGPA